MAIIAKIIRWIKKKCDDCGDDEGVYVNHPTFGTAKTCCIRASQ